MPKMTLEEFTADKPVRPAELDRLDAFVGKWKLTGTANMEMLEEPLEMTGTIEYQWEGNKWYLVNHGTYSMTGIDDMSALETWSYDAHSEVFRYNWIDSMGSSGSGKVKYDERDDIWRLKLTSHSGWGKSTTKATVEFIDADTMKWTWVEHMGLTKTMDMTSTMRRQN